MIRVDQLTGVASGKLLATRGLDLELTPGQELEGRVLTSDGQHAILSLRGHRVMAETRVPLTPGDLLRLAVVESSGDRVVLRLLSRGEAAGRAALQAGDLTHLLQGLGLPADAVRLQLARALLSRGLPLARDALEAAGTLLSGIPDPTEVEALADLVARGIPLNERSLELALSRRADPRPFGEQVQPLREDLSRLLLSLGRAGASAEQLSRLQEALDKLPITSDEATDPERLAGRLARLVEDAGTPIEAKLARSGAEESIEGDLRVLLERAQAEIGQIEARSRSEALSVQLRAVREAAEHLERWLELDQLQNAGRSDGQDLVLTLPLADEAGLHETRIRARPDGEGESELAQGAPSRLFVLEFSLRNLGFVEVAVLVQSDQISCQVACSDEETGAQVRGQQHLLRQALENVGYRVDDVRCFVARAASAEKRTAAVPPHLDVRA